MLKTSLLIACFAILAFTSCQKDIKDNTVLNTTSGAALAATSTVQTGVMDTSSSWTGTYDGMADPYPVLADDDIIKGGLAQLPYLDRQFNFSKISYTIPAQYNIGGDSISFEARVKNPKSTSFSDYDIVLQLTGEQHSATVHFVAEDAYSMYTTYSVGDEQYSGLKQLVHYFGTLQTIKLAQKDYYTAVYINNTLAFKFKYKQKNTIGRISSLSIAFKGYGSCTETGLKSSLSKKPIMSEDFNTDGQSTVMYY